MEGNPNREFNPNILFGKTLYDTNIERNLIAEIFDNKNIFYYIAEILEAGDFYEPKCRIVYEMLYEHWIKNNYETLNVEFISNKLKDKGIQFSEFVGITMPLNQYAVGVNWNNYSEKYRGTVGWAHIIKDYSDKRKVMSSISILMDNPAHEFLFTVEKKLKLKPVINEKEELELAYKEFTDRVFENESPTSWYQDWPVPGLNDCIGAIRPYQIIMFGALEKSGKTKFVIENIWRLLMQDFPVYFFSCEMPASRVMEWIWSSMACVDSFKIEHPISGRKLQVTKEELERIDHAKNQLAAKIKFLKINPNPKPRVSDIAAGVQSFKREFSKGLIVLDFIQQVALDTRKGVGEWKLLEDFAFDMVAIAKTNNVPMLFLSQMTTQPGEMATTKHFRGSAGLRQAATYMIVANNMHVLENKFETDVDPVVFDFHGRGPGKRRLFNFHKAIGRFEITNKIPDSLIKLFPNRYADSESSYKDMAANDSPF